MCNFWNKHSCVCFSAQCSRQSGSPACRVQLEPRTLGQTPSGPGERAPPNSHRATPSGQTCLEANLGPLRKLAERPRRCRCYSPRRGSECQESSRSFPFGIGVGHDRQDNRESLAVGSPCTRTLRRSEASPGASQMGKPGSREGKRRE